MSEDLVGEELLDEELVGEELVSEYSILYSDSGTNSSNE